MNIPSIISANSPEFTSIFQKSKPLKIKFGIDPTSPDIHLGHFVVINQFKQLQEWGHQINIIIGDFTAAIGDPTGRSTTRPVLSSQLPRAKASGLVRHAQGTTDIRLAD